MDRTVVELAAGLHRSTSTVYRWLATAPPPDVQRAVDAWLRAIDARTVDWERVPHSADGADALATRSRVLADRAIRLIRRRATAETSVLAVKRLLEQLSRQAINLAATTNLLSMVLRHGDAAVAAWTAESDPILLWVSFPGAWSAPGVGRDRAAVLGRPFSALNAGLADELRPALDDLLATSGHEALHTRGDWPLRSGTGVRTEGVWRLVRGAHQVPFCLWTVFRIVDGHAGDLAPGWVLARS